MKQIKLIAAGEWRYWFRSHLALGGVALFAALLIATSVLTASRMEAERHTREHQQNHAEETFLSQPDRHPHRMVHYGHYVFRTPALLAIFDPGLDPVTGKAIFLEGHRQNTGTFAESSASADLGGLSLLTPAMVYQLFAPLLIILLGHGAIVREREAKVLAPLLAQGVSATTVLLGKALALFSFIAVILVPLIVVCAISLLHGEQALAVSSLLLLAVLCALWIAISLVLPSLAVDITARNAPIAGKIETELRMMADKRQLGDGHNANDPAFQQLRADLLKKYQVDKVEDLPINYRGLVAQDGEKKLTEVLNKYAEQRMAGELKQASLLGAQGWLSPALAIAVASRRISGTDLSQYHRFLREAETLRYDFVQDLNRSHAEELSYEDDINRNKDEAGWKKARVAASNWAVLDRFRFEPEHAGVRLAHAASPFTMLLLWLGLAVVALLWSAGRLKP